MTQDTVSGVYTGDDGGGVYTGGGGVVEITNSTTITNNSTSGDGGGLFKDGCNNVELQSTIIAGNFGPATVPDDVNGTVDTNIANNLIGIDTDLSGITNGPNGNQVGTGTPLDPMSGARGQRRSHKKHASSASRQPCH